MAFLQELTPEEIALIPSYRQFWYETAFSTAKLNHKQVQDSIQSLYKIFELEIPSIHFCNNLFALIEESRDFFQQSYGCEDGSVFPSQVMAQIHELQMSFFDNVGHWDMALTFKLDFKDGQEVEHNISSCLQQTLLSNLPACFQGYEMYTYWVFPRVWYASEASLYDFHLSSAQRTLFKAYDDVFWQIYRQLVQSSSWFTAFESDCFVCERPIDFLFNSDGTKVSSILFVDGAQLTLL
ncbi:MAG: hypothetical protein KME12_19260 [Trichocoleus desertorum ATA4-8-CV12]|jgi:hypothetical protein|nr:hypothetical protein [Trichocoleus desertorum ATA4-8-CV12]